MASEQKRRNSLERYQPKGNVDTAGDSDLSDTFNTMTINNREIDSQGERESKTSNKSRRGVNSHLYGKQDSGRGRGRGRDCGHDRDRSNNQQHKRPEKDLTSTTSNTQKSLNRDEKKSDQQQQQQQDRNQSWGQRQFAGGNTITFQATGPSSRHRQSDQQARNEMNQVNGNNRNKAPKRNTETFKPSHKPPDVRILCAPEGWTKYSREIQSRDVLIVNGLFCQPDDLTFYEKLLGEIKTSGIDQEDLWKLWHGDSHLIADDKLKWKEACPTFHMVLHKIQEYFEMDIKATRLNWYRDSKEWKPFHHDAAAIKPDKAKTQNLTVAVSFGAERDAAFEHAKTKSVVSMPQPNGTIYVFAKDVNIIWRHGILQVPPEKYHNHGRISIIAWGWAAQTPV